MPEVLQMLDSNASQYADRTPLNINEDINDNISNSTQNNTETFVGSKVEKSMSLWLIGQLKKAGVLDVIEPYWSSNYRQVRHVYIPMNNLQYGIITYLILLTIFVLLQL